MRKKEKPRGGSLRKVVDKPSKDESTSTNTKNKHAGVRGSSKARSPDPEASTSSDLIFPKPSCKNRKKLFIPSTCATSAGEASDSSVKTPNDTLCEADKFFCCPKCSRYFSQEQIEPFKLHLKDDCCVKKRFPCARCARIFITSVVLEYHILNMHTYPNPESKHMKIKPRRESIWKNPARLKANKGKTDKDEWPEDEAQAGYIANETGIWRCWICFYESDLKGLWRTHMNRVHSDVLGHSLECSHCNLRFTQQHHLREHTNEVHADRIGFKCNDCGRRFLVKNMTHHCVKIICEVCGKVLNSKGDQTKHLRRAHPEHHPYKCGHCPKMFKQKQYLTVHMRVHEDLRPYPCDLCDKKFRAKSNLNNHRRIHTGEKPYVCHSCGASFTSPSLLSSHMGRHDGSKKKHSCNECGRSFRIQNDLKRHQLTHSGEKPYACSVCGRTFNRKGNCADHEKTHFNDDMKHSCEKCGQVFKWLRQLNMHVREVHENPGVKPVKSTGSRKSKRTVLGNVGSVEDESNSVGSETDGKAGSTQFMEVEDIASNVEVVGEQEQIPIADEIAIQTLGVWEHAEFELLNGNGPQIFPMYVTVLPSGSNGFESIEEVEVLEQVPLQVEFVVNAPAESYLEIVKAE